MWMFLGIGYCGIDSRISEIKFRPSNIETLHSRFCEMDGVSMRLWGTVWMFEHQMYTLYIRPCRWFKQKMPHSNTYIM